MTKNQGDVKNHIAFYDENAIIYITTVNALCLTYVVSDMAHTALKTD